MARRIELSFPTDPPEQPQDQYSYGSTSSGDVQDTVVLQADSDTPEVREQNIAKLEQLQVIGQQRVGEMVRGMERVLGREFYPSKIVQENEETTKILLEVEQGQPVEMENFHPAKSEKSIYAITDGGEVNTSMFRHPQTDSQDEDRIFVRFQTRFTQAPSVIVGLNFLNANLPHSYDPYCKFASKIYGTVDEIHDHIFEIYSKVHYFTTGRGYPYLYGIGYTWLAVPTHEFPLLQTGTLYDSNDMVLFNPPYTLPPKVIVWLNSISSENSLKVTVSTSAITQTGFKVDLIPGKSEDSRGQIWEPTSISWFAYPQETPGICSGDLHPIKGTAGIITFDKAFRKPPRRILVALNWLETHTVTPRVRIIHEAVSERGMAVRVESWGSATSTIEKAGVAYIAME